MDENSKAAAIQLDPKELFFLVAKFLEASPCQEAAKVLKAELTDHQLLPLAKDWLGQERSLSYAQVTDRYKHVKSQHLELVCSKLLSLLQCHNYQKLSGLNSLLGSGATESLYNRENGNKVFVLSSALHISQRYKELLLNSQCQPTANLCNLVFARTVSTNFTSHVWRSPFLYERLTKLYTVLGHLAAVFCVLFDHTGRCIITGADDDLLKVWSSRSGQLLATLRGHFAEVTDISLSPDNTMIASGSLDKSVRVWCAQTSAPVAVLLGHQSHVTSVQFSPASDEECRYLASTGKDGFLCFWQWLPDQETFSCNPIKFMEKNRMGDQTLCSAFSAGGKYFATGGTDHVLRVYVCIPGPPLLQAELKGHKGRIMSIQFGNTGEAVFATGACDATARIWRYLEGKWTSIALVVSKENIGYPHGSEKPQVTMVGWEKTDRYLVTAFTPDCVIRVWDATSGDLVKKLMGHQGEVFVLELHPTDSRILLTAGHDGLVMVWDMLAGQCLKMMEMKGEDGNLASIFDCRFSPDGLMCAAVDMNGYLTLMGFGSSKEYDKHPREQFFHTDYRPLIRDNHHYVVDEQSQVPPHLLPPPYLVDIDGNTHPIRYQEALLRLIRPAKQISVDQSTEDLEDYDDYMRKRLSVVKEKSFRFGRLRQQRVSEAEASAEDGPSSQHMENEMMETSSRGDVWLQTCSEGPVSEKENMDAGGKTKAETAAVNGCSFSSLNIDGDLEGMPEIVAGQSTNDVVSLCSDGEGTSQEVRSPCNLQGSVDDVPVQSHMSVENAGRGAQETDDDVVNCVAEDAGTSSGRGAQGMDKEVVNHVEEDAGVSSGRSGSQGQNEEVVNRVEEDAGTSLGRSGRQGQDEEVVNHVEEDVGISSGRSGSQGQNEEVVNRVEEDAGTSLGRSGRQGQDEEVVNHVEEDVGISSGRSGSQGQNEEVVNRVEEDAGTSLERSGRQGQDEVVVNRVEEDAGISSGRSGRQGQYEERVNRVEADAERGREHDGEAEVDVEEESQNGQPNIQNMLASLVYSLGLNEVETKCIIALWHNRVIIPPLEQAQLGQELARRQQLFNEEQQNFEFQNQKTLLRDEQATLATEPSVLTDKGRALRSGRTLPEGGPREGSRDSESARLDSSEEEAGDEASVMEVERPWEDSNYDSSDISDWTQEAGIDINNILRRRTKKRKKSIDSLLSNDDDLQDEEEEEEEDLSAGHSVKNKLTGRASKKNASEKGSSSLLAHSPPDWITQTKPLLTPYLPQVGDIVVYFHQGHRIYVESVQAKKLHPVHKSTIPWQKYVLMPQELCQVTNVRYSVGPPTLCCITLTLLQPFNKSAEEEEGGDSDTAYRMTNDGSSKGGQRDRIRFSFRYHDMDSVLDFLILESLYKVSVRRSWEVGDRFRSLIDSKYWYGSIKEKKPFSEDYPNSYWQSCRVLWDDGATDLLSPWDMEAISQRSHSNPDSNLDPNTDSPNLDQDPDRSLDQDPDQSLDQDPDRGLDQDPDRGCDQDPDRGLDQDPDRGLDQDPDRGLNQDRDCGLDLDPDRGLDQDSDCDLERDPKPELYPNLQPSSLDVSEEAPSRLTELLALQKAGEKEAWGGEGEPARILRGLELAGAMDESFMFMQPVSLDQVPEYCTCVAFPTDLQTIKEKLKNGLYRRKQALLWELTLIAKNAVTFNEEDSLIVKHARVLVQTLGEFIKSPGVSDPMECYTSEPRGEVEEEVHLNLTEKDVFVDPINLPLPPSSPAQDEYDVESPKNISLLSSTSSLTHNSSDPSSNWPMWLDKATLFLGQLLQHENAQLFLDPVSTTQYEDYLDYVKEPMDFNTIRKKLAAGCYPILQDFVSDIRLIFMNSQLYNKKGSEIYKITTDLQLFFNNRLSCFLQGFIGHQYQTRQALGRTTDISTASTMSPSVTSSVSSIDDSSIVSAQDQYGGGGSQASVCRKVRGRRGSMTGRGLRRAVEMSYKDSAGSDSGGGNDEDGDDDDDEDGRSSTRSVSAPRSNHSYHRHCGVPVTRRQTRSMRKDITHPSSEALVLVDKERFSMTLRTRSQRKRKRLYDSEEDEEEEVVEESMDGASEEESEGERRQTRERKERPCIKQEVSERSTRSLRKRSKRTKYFDDENSRDRVS